MQTHSIHLPGMTSDHQHTVIKVGVHWKLKHTHTLSLTWVFSQEQSALASGSEPDHDWVWAAQHSPHVRYFHSTYHIVICHARLNKRARLKQTLMNQLRVTKGQETSDWVPVMSGERWSIHIHLSFVYTITTCSLAFALCTCQLAFTFSFSFILPDSFTDLFPLLSDKQIHQEQTETLSLGSLLCFPLYIQTDSAAKPPTETAWRNDLAVMKSLNFSRLSAEAPQLKHPRPLSVCDCNAGVKMKPRL